MNPADFPIPPLDAETLAKIQQRSESGESVVRIIRSLRLDVTRTMESLRRYHVDEIIAAKKRARERI